MCRNLSTGLGLLTLPCILVGYLTIYFFFAFMFWINAMAARYFFLILHRLEEN